MALQSFECKNCGTSLQVQPGQDLIKCPSCRSVHQIEHRADGTLQVTMMKEVREAVGRVETKADGIATVQKAMADRENARTELEETKEAYAQFTPVRDQKILAARNSRGTAIKCLMIGIVAAIGGIALLVNEMGFGGAVAGLGALLLVIGVLWIKSASGTIAEWVEKDRSYQAKMADLLARTRRKIEI